MIPGMNQREVELLELARRAVGLWAAFPVEAEPRPVVLAQPVISDDTGLRGGRAREAWSDGRYRWEVDVPEGVRELAKQSADELRLESERAPLLITRAHRTTRTFQSDRGSVVLPAYQLQGPAVIGSLWVLDPDADFWQPNHPPLPLKGPFSSQMRSAWSRVEASGRSITFPWSGAPGAQYRTEVIETATAVTAIAIGETKAYHETLARITIGRGWQLPAELSQPLGNRVFVDLRGQAIPVVHPENAAAPIHPAGK
jgi:hypothetical protein